MMNIFNEIRIQLMRRTMIVSLLLTILWISGTIGNRPPQFVLNQGQSEIVLRLKEGKNTPIGSIIHKLKGFDYDDDSLTFGLRGQIANDLLRIESTGTDEANIYLKKELDREAEDSYSIILTLTDGHLGGGSFVTQSLLILVEDVNDNSPICRTNNSTVKVNENSNVPMILTTIECTDLDEGPFGQVIYRLQTDPGDENIFSIQTKDGKGVLRLLRSLDYDKKFLYQLKVIAMDRAISGQVNTAINPILVEVVDESDRPPEWLVVPSVTRIPEDVPTGTPVLQVRAMDGDKGVNNKISYTLLNENDLFAIESDSGIVFTVASLDREDERNGGSYILQILATEIMANDDINFKEISSLYSVSTEVTILLLDINDETPTFTSRSYVAEIVENQPIDVPVTFLGDSIAECYDHDLGLNGTFRLYTEGDGGIFEVTPSQGINQVSFLVRVKNPSRLDYERLKVINFTLVAEEVGPQRKKSKVGMTVFLRDANDNSPQFEKEVYKVKINENPVAGTAIVQVKAHDADSGLLGTEGIRYTSITGSIANELILNPITGVITVGSNSKTSLNREISSIYYLTVEARDSGGRGNRNTVQIQVQINDLNDETPTFLLSRYEGRVFENEQQFITPLIVEAKDGDLPNTKNSEVQYSIVGGNQDGHFSIHVSKGKINIIKALDFEALPGISGYPESNVKRVNLTVRANDNGNPPLFSLVPVTIWVLDKNDYNPVFKKVRYHKLIREDVSGGTDLLKIEAYDGDSSMPFNKIFYRMETGAMDKFNVDSETGILRISPGATLDYNIQSSYMLQVYAIDGGGLKSPVPAIINVTLLDINNKPPHFIVNTSDGYFHAKVKENSPKGTYITQIRAIDPDQKPILRYRIDFNKSEGRSPDGKVIKGSAVKALFVLDENDGILRVGQINIDRESVEYVRLTIEVEDKGSELGKQVAVSQMLIQILDEPDNKPIFRQLLYSATLLENSKEGALALSVQADDADADANIRYSILPMYSDPDRVEFPLTIDPETGAIVVIHPKKIDREKRQWLNFSVLAEDSSKKIAASSVGKAEVAIRILDSNDNSPVFTSDEIQFEVPENVKIGTIIGRVSAIDPDEGANGRVSYTLDRKSSMEKFAIDPTTGSIRVVSLLDREETAKYLLVVQAFDNWYGFAAPDSRSSFKNVQVILLDINDSPPVFEDGSDNFSVTEFYEGVIGTIQGTDADAINTPNSWIQFKIVAGNELGLFALEHGKNQAKLIPARSLKGFYGNYTLKISAMDGGKPSNTAFKDFRVQITDFNDNPPRFITSQNLTVAIPENSTIGTTVVQIRAIDSDTGLNGIVRYRLKKDVLQHSDDFRINPTTGVVTLARTLNRRKIKRYTLRIEAYDLGQIPLSSDLELRIKVSKVTEFLPRFTLTSLVISFKENDSNGEEKIQLPETTGGEDDFDNEESPPEICYFIESNDVGVIEDFYLDPEEHWITPKVVLDREERENYTFTVVATIHCYNGEYSANLPLNVAEASKLRLTVLVKDENDNRPQFTKKIFSGGISTGSMFGSVVMDLLAFDEDAPNTVNSHLSYFIVPPIRMSLTEGFGALENNHTDLFIIDGSSILLNFDPQPDMKGFFSMEIGVRDGGGLTDKALALVYLLREDQKVKVVVRRNPVEVRAKVEQFLLSIGNITGARVNSDMGSFRFHQNNDGTVDKTKTDFFIHFVHPERHTVLEVNEALRLIDLKIEELDDLFKEFNVIDTQGSTLSSSKRSKGLSAEGRSLFLVYASGTAAFLAILLLVVISIACAQRSKYQRRLKAATANAYGSSSTMLPRNGNVPNTNVHSGEGSNPIWMQAYHNNWYKEDTRSISGNSETRDSLEDNGRGSSPPSSHMRSFLGNDDWGDRSRRKESQHGRPYHRNIIYGNSVETNSTCLILKKHLETTEL